MIGVTRLVVAALLCAAGASCAQDRLPIEVVSSGDDSVGQRLVYQVKEQIARSSIFRAAGSGERRFQIILRTMDPDKGRQQAGVRTAYALTLLGVLGDGPNRTEIHGGTTVGVCGTNVVAQCAEGILAEAAVFK